MDKLDHPRSALQRRNCLVAKYLYKSHERLPFSVFSLIHTTRLLNDSITFFLTRSQHLVKKIVAILGEINSDIYSFCSRWNMIYCFPQSSTCLKKASQAFFPYILPGLSLFSPPTFTRSPWNESSFVVLAELLRDTCSQFFRSLIIL